MELHYAESGRSGIDLLRRMPDTDIVLVDIMMPDMDGYETMREIRSIPEFDSMPIVAVTAKAMKGDRQKCIAAGASDYVAKPVDMDQLVSVLRVWLHRSDRGEAAPEQPTIPPPILKAPADRRRWRSPTDDCSDGVSGIRLPSRCQGEDSRRRRRRAERLRHHHGA